MNKIRFIIFYGIIFLYNLQTFPSSVLFVSDRFNQNRKYDLCVLDISTGKIKKFINLDAKWISAISISPNYRYVCILTSNYPKNEVMIADLENKKTKIIFETLQSTQIFPVSFNWFSNNKEIAILIREKNSTRDTFILIIDIESKRVVKKIKGTGIFNIFISPKTDKILCFTKEKIFIMDKSGNQKQEIYKFQKDEIVYWPTGGDNP